MINIEDRQKKMPGEFKKLAKDFADKGFITNIHGQSYNMVKDWIIALDDIWFGVLCNRNDANCNA